MREPDAADVAATFEHYEPYGIVPDGWMDKLRRRSQPGEAVRTRPFDVAPHNGRKL